MASRKKNLSQITYLCILLITSQNWKIHCFETIKCDHSWTLHDSQLDVYRCSQLSPIFNFSSFSENTKELYVTCKNEEIDTFPSSTLTHLYKLDAFATNNCDFLKIESDAFKNLSLSKLAIVGRQSNKTWINISKNMFDPIQNLTEVVISMGLYQVPDGFFCPLHSLQYLNLSQNNLQSMEGILCSQKYLVTLDLSHNHLQRIYKKDFQFPSLNLLDLSFNDIEEIENLAFDHMNNLKKIYINNNKIKITNHNRFNGILTWNSVQFDYLSLDFNELSYMPVQYLGSLEIKELRLSHNNLFFNDSSTDIFQNSRFSLQKLDLSNNCIDYLPSHIFNNLERLLHLSLANNLLHNLDWYLCIHCTELRIIDFSGNKLQEIPSHMTRYPNLLSLDLSSNNISFIKNVTRSEEDMKILKALNSLNLNGNRISFTEVEDSYKLPILQNLQLTDNEICEMKMIFINVEKQLNLRNNSLEEFNFDSINTTLEFIDLSFNRIRRIGYNLGSIVYNLQEFHANDNNLQEFKIAYFPQSIKVIDISNNKISYFDQFVQIDLPKLLHFNLKNNLIAEIPPENILYKELSFNQERPEVNIEDNPLLCSCRNVWMNDLYANNSIYYPIFFGLINCAVVYSRIQQYFTTVFIPTMEKKNMLCEDTEQCSKPCRSFFNNNRLSSVLDCGNTTWSQPLPNPSNYTTMFFDGNKNLEKFAASMLRTSPLLLQLYMNKSGLTSIEKNLFRSLQKLEELYLQENFLTLITEEDFHHTPKLRKLFLHQNKLKYLSPGTFSNLSNLKHITLHNNLLVQPKFWNMAKHLTSITFGKNPFKCDCDFAMSFQQWVITKQRSITFEDIRDTYCVTPNFIPIMDFNDSKCHEVIKEVEVNHLVETIVPTVSIAIFFIIAIIIIYLYRVEMQVWFYSRYGVRLFYNNEEDDDGKVYDAFISYANEDDEWVIEELMPQLSEYRLCIHQRDFPVGEYITDSIMQAVESSCRTVVILTPDFVKSKWCQFEFNTAHVQSLLEKRKRLVVVILKEVDNDELDRNLLAYLKTNTYLDIKDALFWNKLKFALPDLKVE